MKKTAMLMAVLLAAIALLSCSDMIHEVSNPDRPQWDRAKWDKAKWGN